MSYQRITNLPAGKVRIYESEILVIRKFEKIRDSLMAIVFLCCLVNVSQAQLLDSLTLELMPAYTSIEEAMKEPEKVIKLELRKQKLKTFPLEIVKFKNLQYLDLSKNSIDELPEQIAELTNLQYFLISKNKLGGFPKEIGKLINLHYINANQNEMVMLPPQIGKLINLTNMDLWSNNLTTFPDEMSELKKLKILDLRVIIIDDETQQNLKNWLPNTTIYFSPNCKCK